uniref:50S ribosomal protein L21, chloroplastic n=1 Tax=Erigeron canadensis TaxID=72917 RepID=UPI001CB92E89|nr:50S ribosomal protein L21, chloroplastic [Erigeron canadensis]
MAITMSCSPSIYSCCLTSSFPTKKRLLLPPTITTFNFPSPHFNSRVSSSSKIIVPKLSETQEAPSISVESPAIEQLTITDDQPKGQEVFAVVMIGGRQYIVFPGRFLYTQRLKGANVDDKIILNKVLLVGTKTSTYIGKPIVPNAAVHAVVEEQGLDPKVVVYKYKKKKNYRRNIGHRQPNTRIRILGISGYQDSPATTLD